MRTKDEQDLLKACRYSRFDEIEALLKKGINPQFTLTGYPGDWTEMENYQTPIGEIMHHLYSPKHVDAVRTFLDAGVDVNSYTHHTVIGTRSTPLGKALLAHKNDSGMTQPEIQQEIVDLLLSRGANVTLLAEEDLAGFIGGGEPRLLESLLNAGLNPSAMAKGKTLLEHVISAWTGSSGDNQAEKAKLLIRRGADLSVRDANGQSLVQRAARPDIVNLLLEKDDRLFDCMTLHDDVILESPEFVQRLINRGDNLNALNNEGNTPLMQAAKRGDAKAAFVLMEAGANLNIHNSFGETAMHLAMANAQNYGHDCDYTGDRRFPILLDLYTRGAIPQLDERGRTPLMRCHVASKSYVTIRFCISEFSKFEAQYYGFDPTEYASEMWSAYEKQMGAYAAFMNLPIYSQEHLFTGKLTKRSLPLIEPTQEELVSRAIKALLIALKSNNEATATSIIRRFPQIDLNQITDEKGCRPLSIVIRSVTYSKNDCLPLLTLLLANHVDVNQPDNNEQKDTPLLACTSDRHYIDIRSMRFLLANGANPNLGNATNYTPLHKAVGTFRGHGHHVEEAIELLLQNQANPEALTHDNKKPIDLIVLGWEKNLIPSIFAKFCDPQKDNLIDSALTYACSIKNRTLFAQALKQNLGISIKYNPDDEASYEITHPLKTIIESIQRRQDLTPYARNRLALLNTMQRDPNLPEKAFSSAELETLYKLTYSLYQADLDLIKAVSQLSSESEYKDTKSMHNAARKIQFWVRSKLSKDIAPPMDAEKNESSGAKLT